MVDANSLDLSKLPADAQLVMQELYNVLLARIEKHERRFQSIIQNPVTVDRIIIPSREERNERKSIH